MKMNVSDDILFSVTAVEEKFDTKGKYWSFWNPSVDVVVKRLVLLPE